MQGKEIPESDHISRYCKPVSLAPSTNKPTLVSFMLRKDESYGSVNWLEYLSQSTRENEIRELRKEFGREGYELRKTGLFAILNVGKTRDAVVKESTDSRKLHFTHEPVNDDSSHGGIHGYTHEDNMIAQLIADTVTNTYNAFAT